MTTYSGRHEYTHHKTYAAAADHLESLFAEGLVSEGEFPQIEHRPKRQPGRQYIITLAYSY